MIFSTMLTGPIMVTSSQAEKIVLLLNEAFPSTHTFPNHNANKDYEFLFAVILSAQATDASVNQATSVLFKKYPNLLDYNDKNKDGILTCVKSVGLSNTKVKHILQTASILINQYHGKLPQDREELMKLPGVGFKTSGVVLGELYDYPLIPVDTHVYRISHRMGLVSNRLDPKKTEIALEKVFKEEANIHLHQRLILLGRTFCKAKKPDCLNCPVRDYCNFFKKNSKKEN